MKVVIAGSRDLVLGETPEETSAKEMHLIKIMSSYILDTVKSLDITITEIISGGAQGPDKLGERFARVFDIPCTVMKADWNRYGKSAGPIRNKEMAEECDAAFIFWDGKSRGTKNMIDNMYKLNKPVYIRIIDNG